MTGPDDEFEFEVVSEKESGRSSKFQTGVPG